MEDLPEPARLLAIVLCTATRIEPELVRAIRVEVRPNLTVSAEAALWFGPWSLRSTARSMALHHDLLRPLRDLLRAELERSADGALVREAGEVIFRVHEHLSPTLALEEQVTWAAVCADAGFRPQEADADIDRLLERALRAAVQTPDRRQRLQRWFVGAWQRFPDRVRQTPAALELFGVLGGEDYALDRTGTIAPVPGAHLDGVEDVIVAVRHDGSHVTIGDPRWPAEGILVPDTQPRVLEVAPHVHAWDDAQKVRVPRGAQMALPVAHVPVFLRTARGVVYELGARGASDVLAYPAQRASRSPHRGLLGTRITELRDRDALQFGIAARLVTRSARTLAITEPDRLILTDLTPRMARASDIALPLLMKQASHKSQLVVVTGGPSSGRTRAAFEAVRQALGDWWIWSPPVIGRRQALVDAVNDDRLGSHTVLWLDDLDRSLIGDAGEELARALAKVLADPALAPVLMVATAEPDLAMRTDLGPAAHTLASGALFVQAATGKQGKTTPAADAVSRVCDRAIARAAAAEPGHKIEAPSHLPERPIHFTGRAAAMQRLHALWADTGPRHRMIAALAGMPGSGKTALAVEAVHQARERGWFPGGVLWTSLAEQPFTPTTLLSALGMPPLATQTMSHDEAWLLCSALMHQVTGAGARPALLVLDGAARGDHSALSNLAPGLSVLLTTRSTVPPTAEPIAVDPLSATEAVQLLTRILPAAHVPGTRLGEAMDEIAALSESCGRLPLALAAAAKLLEEDPALTVTTLLLQLQRAQIMADVFPVGDGSVRHALDWGYLQLTPVEASAFRLLGLMPGESFSGTAALVLTGSAPDGLLEKLADLHLLRRSAQSADQWRINSLVKQHAADLCRRHALEDHQRRALMRLMGYYEQYAREADTWTRAEQKKRIVFSSRQQAVQWLEDERENLVAAVDICLREGLAQTGQAIALALAEFLTQTRQFSDLLRVMNAVLNSPAADESDRYTRSAALNNFAVAMATTGDFDAAMTALKDAARLGSEGGDRSAAYALMLGNLGATLLIGRRHKDAVRVLTDAADRFTAIDDRMGLTQVLINLGTALLDLGEAGVAVTHLERALEASEHVEISIHDEAILLTALGTAQLRSDRTEEGLTHLSLAAIRAGRMGEAGGQGAVLEALGRAMLEVRHFEEAIGLFSRALVLYRKLDDRPGQARAGNNLGLALLEDGEETQALLELERARDAYLSINDLASAAQCLNNVGNALRRQGRHEEATLTLARAASELRGVGDERALAEALLNLGLSSVELGDIRRAHAALSESAETHKSLGDITSRARALHALGRMAHTDNDMLAVEHLRAATEAFRQGRDTTGLVDSLLLLSDLLNATGQHKQAQATLAEALQVEASAERDTSHGPEGQSS
ncbi:NB-ARC domain-containing protein [Streptomyces sp. NPDC013457]|uniref:NB-ARC domain-containing protein n=1 Tax=Streptomyces sp. NPDC013457 TaxID=3364866 RepID=UPI0036F7F85E